MSIINTKSKIEELLQRTDTTLDAVKLFTKLPPEEKMFRFFEDEFNMYSYIYEFELVNDDDNFKLFTILIHDLFNDCDRGICKFDKLEEIENLLEDKGISYINRLSNIEIDSDDENEYPLENFITYQTIKKNNLDTIFKEAKRTFQEKIARMFDILEVIVSRKMSLFSLIKDSSDTVESGAATVESGAATVESGAASEKFSRLSAEQLEEIERLQVLEDHQLLEVEKYKDFLDPMRKENFYKLKLILLPMKFNNQFLDRLVSTVGLNKDKGMGSYENIMFPIRTGGTTSRKRKKNKKSKKINKK